VSIPDQLNIMNVEKQEIFHLVSILGPTISELEAWIHISAIARELPICNLEGFTELPNSGRRPLKTLCPTETELPLPMLSHVEITWSGRGRHGTSPSACRSTGLNMVELGISGISDYGEQCLVDKRLVSMASLGLVVQGRCFQI